MVQANSSSVRSAWAPRNSEMVEAAVNRTPVRGRFVTFEGGEGSGKSTQIKVLAERLNTARLRAIVTREPGGSPGAEIIRHVVLSGMGKLLGAEAGRTQRPCPHGDRARAQSGNLGAVRPVFGFNAGISGQAGQGIASGP